MEVKDVYEATVHIENALKKISADLLPKVNYKVKLSKKKPITLLTKMRFYSEKFNSYNKMQVRVPFGKKIR